MGRWNHALQSGGAIDKKQLDGYFRLLDAAVNVGARTFVCGINYDDSISLYKNYANAIRFFDMLLKRAAGSGIKIAVQNCDWNNFVVSPREWEVVLGELPELYIKFDASHSYNRGGDYLAELSDWESASLTFTSRARCMPAGAKWTIRPRVWTTSTGGLCLQFFIPAVTTATSA